MPHTAMLTLLLVAGLAASARLDECPGGRCRDEREPTNKSASARLSWERLIPGHKSIVLFTKELVNWHKAAAKCRAEGMQLAPITSKKKSDELKSAIVDGGHYNLRFWIGGSDLGSYNNYTWLATGQPFDYTNWAPGEPNHWRTSSTNEEEHCVHTLPLTDNNASANGLAWNDAFCSQAMHFVCEQGSYYSG